MGQEIILYSGGSELPALITREGQKTARRFLEFFTANIRNKNTRLSYARAVGAFLAWCEMRGLDLAQIEPMIVAAYIEQHPGSPQTVKQHLAAIRMLFDWLVIGQVMPFNPAASVRGPRYSIKKGKTPVLSAEDARRLLDSIDTNHVVGLRDRALIGVMVYSFARVSAVVGMKIKDYYANGKRYWLRLHEKGGKFHEVPTHHTAEKYLDEYIEAAGIAGEKNKPLFRTTRGQSRTLTANQLSRFDAYQMIKRRATNSYYNEFGLSQSQIQAKGTLCITIAANIAECGFLDFDACVPDSIVCFRAMDKAIEKYIYYYLKIAKEELERFAPATAQKNINLGILNDLSTSLPPLAEQKRIIKKLERLMSLCDELEANIKQGKANAYSLMQTALKEALRPPISQAA